MKSSFNGEQKQALLQALVLEGAEACAQNFGGGVDRWMEKVRHAVGKIASCKTELLLRNAVNSAVGKVCAERNVGGERHDRSYLPASLGLRDSHSIVQLSAEDRQMLDPEFRFQRQLPYVPEPVTFEEVLDRLDQEIDHDNEAGA